jgi:fatty acid desaturase
MSFQPGFDAPQEPPPPPPVADRRQPERRSYERRAEDRTQFVRTTVAAGMAVSLGLFVLFLFFWALGAIDVRDAVAASVAALVLALVWVAGFLYRRREEGSRVAAQRYRERRGF